MCLGFVNVEGAGELDNWFLWSGRDRAGFIGGLRRGWEWRSGVGSIFLGCSFFTMKIVRK